MKGKSKSARPATSLTKLCVLSKDATGSGKNPKCRPRPWKTLPTVRCKIHPNKNKQTIENKTNMKKSPKRYPMNGPNTEIQALMASPRRNARRLAQYFGDRKGMRAETLAVLDLK